MKIKLDEGAYEPTRANPTDAGLDLRCMERVLVPPKGSAVIHTGVHVQLPPYYAGEIVSKSGLMVNHDIITTGLIDEGFTGEIIVKAFNLGDVPYTFEPGEKCSQLVTSRVCYSTVQLVDEIDGGPRGENGYGSTGRL